MVFCSNDNLKIIRLPNNTKPFFYKINLIIPHLEEINPIFYGESNIDIIINRATKNISLHSRGLEINEIETTLVEHEPYTFYKPIKHSYDNIMNILTLHFENTLFEGIYSLNMKFSGIIFEIDLVNRGFMKFPYTNKEEEQGIMAATYFEPNGARQVFPCWDEPELKAIFNISVMHHQKYLILSNMQMQKQVTGKDDMIQTCFDFTSSMPTYLVAIVVIPKCDFYHRSNYDQTVNIWCSSFLLSQVTFIYNIAEKVVPFMIQYTNKSEEISKMDHVLIPNFPVDGMENWGLITYNEFRAIYDDNKHSIYKKIEVAKVVTRELVHQWFNLVTPIWWSYLWLKEGFTTFLESYIIDKIFEGWRMMDLFVIRTLQTCLTIDVGSLNSVTLVLNSTFDNMSQYSIELYGKAPVLLRMLHHMITDEIFQKGLIMYLARNRYSSTTPDNLWSAMQSALDESDVPHDGYRIKEVMDTWMNQNSYPEVDVQRISSKINDIMTLSQKCIYKQEINECINNTCINNTCTNEWYIPLTFATRSNPDFSNTVPKAWLRPNKTIIRHLLKREDWIIVNIQQTGYYRVTYDISNWQKISYYLNFENYTNIHFLNRVQVISDLFASVLNEQISGSVFVSLIKYLNREEDIMVWHSLFPIIQRLWKYFFLPEAAHIKTTITSLLGSFLQKIGFSESSHDDDMVKLTRLDTIEWACILGEQYCRKEAAIKLSEHLMNPNVYKFPQWMQKFMYCAGLMTANRTTWDKTLILYQHKNLKNEKFKNSLKKYRMREKFVKLLLRGLSCAEDPNIIINFLNITAFNPTLFNEKERYFAVLCILENHSRNNLILNYILNNFETIKPSVARWADKLGTELWELANEVGRPEELLENWDSSLLDGNFSYVSGKCSPVIGHDSANKNCDIHKKNVNVFRDMELISDSHFYNIPVNTTYSSVHIPTNVYDLTQDVAEDIARTELLDDIFRQNYESDPALSWQYFGTVTGVLRQYPAMQWRTNPKDTNDDDDNDNTIDDNNNNNNYDDDDDDSPVDQYDCRLRNWFIEAATCSKDMVILMDVSGSMTGFGKTIAKTTVNSILDTLSNNDFVTLLKYNNETTEFVPCFKDMLIQATPENLDTFKKSMDKIDTDNVANLTEAFTKAFSLLKTYREERGCDADSPCNQLIMLVTDGVPGGTLGNNLKEVFKKWNWNENSTYIPVRVFTYLIGKEATKMDELQWMVRSCLNLGDYKQVQTQEEVREQVLKYIPVVARPLVLQSVVHPIVWTHAYAKKITLHKDKNIEEDLSTLNTTTWQEYRLLTSVSTPVFDRKNNRSNMADAANDTLFGVAGTDVPIDDIRELTLPYKLGVNGYAFIVSSNGYVILHPDLRPDYKGRLKLNYNSIDLTEVEIFDDEREPRNPGPELLELRSALVDHKRGNMMGIPVKLHYDDNRRVNLEKRDYFYAPLPGTPFSLAVVLSNYGTTWIKVGDEIRRNQNMNMNVSDYFVGDYWRVHPSWVYCRYHYLEGHEFNKPEDELRHFLALMSRPGWRWSQQYEAYSSIDEDVDEESNCGRQTLKHDDYYCNKELMQLLVFDAKATNNNFRDDYIENLSPRARDLAHHYGIFIRFIATQSGLTRWHHLKASKLPNVDDTDDSVVFGDLHRRAVNEPWYKGAIFQSELDSESISLSVSWESGVDAIVTASMSLAPKDGGKKAPAAVVGFQMPMKDLYKRFIELISDNQTTNTIINCAHNWIDCYLLDQNGYIVISDEHNNTGQFMGTQEGAVMLSMVKQGLYNPIDIFDYQALCHETRNGNSANSLMEPLQHVARLLLWFLLRLIWYVTQFVNLPGIHGKVHLDEDAPDPPPPPEPYIYYYSCDQKRTLYLLNETVAAKGVTNHSTYCSRPFYAQRVAHTNLLLVVVDSMYPTCLDIKLEVTPVNISPLEYINSMGDKPCHKIPLNTLKRRKLKNCFTKHPLEHVTYGCGASELMVSLSLLYITVARILYIFV
ncbi:Voltage-dependent calcium channel subunit alpha-2/delta-4 [Trachymyrmex cornetzi]|uniref:Voltage-dependent calcium channel subunit alpha-2/delta-4 n=1 Tax=Trachymyrmex cornetzi TaxID=471704 RepID=A0A151JAZ9_9HYME|nr:Voltage-dependent calcium channel subunit alpha-2/delta-4 [Trachymyrmex cornetzi]